jgi:hypothetical protein
VGQTISTVGPPCQAHERLAHAGEAAVEALAAMAGDEDEAFGGIEARQPRPERFAQRRVRIETPLRDAQRVDDGVAGDLHVRRVRTLAPQRLGGTFASAPTAGRRPRRRRAG